MKALAFRLEAFAAHAVLRLFRALGPVRASDVGGAVARAVGPLLPVSRVADINLRLALPELSSAGRRRVIRGAWDSLGRTLGEFPHIGSLRQTASGPGWEVMGEDTILALAAAGGPAVFFSGHIGNWELLPAISAAYGIRLASMFRAASNPAVDALVAGLRQQAAGAAMPMFPKGSAGAKAALAHLRAGGFLGLLMDQKLNDGVAATLFGHTAMTAPAMAVLALHFRCPVIPCVVQRLGPSRFRLVCEPFMVLPDTGNRKADTLAVVQMMNGCLERWIRERPESWLWMHRRWPKEHYVHHNPGE